MSSQLKSRGKTSRAAIQARVKAGKIKAKAPKPAPKKKQTSAQVGLRNFISDSQTRQTLRNRVLGFLQQQKAEGNPNPWPLIANHLAFEIPFTDAELAELGPMPSATYLEVDPESESKRAPMKSTKFSVVSSLKVYSSLVRKYPYSIIRTKILQAIDIWSQMRDRPVLLEALLHADEFIDPDELDSLSREYQIPNQILGLIHEYNKILSSEPHRPLPPSRSAVIAPEGKVSGTRGTKDVSAQVRKYLQKILAAHRRGQDIEVAEKNARREEEVEEARDSEDSKSEQKGEDITKATRRQLQLYRSEIRSKLITQREIEPRTIDGRWVSAEEQISEEDIDNAIIEASNLPPWAFLAQFISEPISPEQTRKLLDSTPGLDQFGRLFRRMTTREQVDFTTQIFTAYPVAKFPNGPTQSLMTLLTKFYNHLANPSDDNALDNQLATVPSDQFMILFKTLQPGQILHYREIVFGRLVDLSEFDQASILNIYSAYLTEASKLVWDGDEVLIASKTDKRKAIQTPSRIDFILPWTDITRKEVEQLITRTLNAHVLASLTIPLAFSDPKTAVSRALDMIKITLPTGESMSIVDLLGKYFNCLLPAQPEFMNFVRDTTSRLVREFASAPNISPDQVDISNLPIKISTRAKNRLVKQLRSGQEKDRLAYSVDELQREAARLGLDLRGNIRIAVAESKSRLSNQVKLGELTPEQAAKQEEEIAQFSSAYEGLHSRITFEPRETRRKREDLVRFRDQRIDALRLEATKIVEGITESIWNAVVEEGLATKSETEQLRRFISNRITDMKEAAEEEGSDVNIEEFESAAWKEAEDEDVLTAGKIDRVQKYYWEQFQSEISQAKERGLVIEEDDIFEQAWQETIQSGIASSEEIEGMTKGFLDEKPKARVRKATVQKIRKQLQQKVAEMPEAIRLSLARQIQSISHDMNRVDESKRLEMATYFRFISALMTGTWKTRNDPKQTEEFLRQIESEYSSKLPSGYMTRVLEMLTQGRGASWEELMTFTRNYTHGSVMIIKNPLIRQTARRKLRYDRLFERTISTGEIGILRRELPDPFPPHIKECITAHRLKPWLDIPHINRWTFLVADAKGRKRGELGPDERQFFNISKERQFVLSISGEKTMYYFYRPTTAYWIAHCKDYHSESGSCDVSSLQKAFSGSNPQFLELMVQFPLTAPQDPVSTWVSEDELHYRYNGDTDRVKFLSRDPSVYARECAWFKERYRGIEEKLFALRTRQVGDVEEITKMSQFEIRQVLSLLRTKYGESGSGILPRGDVQISAKYLEAALYSRIGREGPITVYRYLTELYNLLLLLDATDPVGKEAVFFQTLVAQCADAYFPALLRDFPSLHKRFPEIFYLPRSESADLLKAKVRGYIEQKVELLVERALLRMVALTSAEFSIEAKLADLDEKDKQMRFLSRPGEQSGSDIDAKLTSLIRGTEANTGNYALNIGALFTREGLNLIAKVPTLTLKNICVNSDEYKDMADSWLMYYIRDDQVHCISKLQLAGMAEAGKYTFRGVEFDHELVDGFSSYADFTAQEITKRSDYIEGAISALVKLPQNKPLFQQLVESRQMFGDLSDDEVANVLGQLSVVGKGANKILDRDDAYLIMIAKNRLADIVDSFIETQIIESAEAFIDENRERLTKEIRSGYNLYHSANVLSPAKPDSTTMKIIAEEDKQRQMVLGSATDLIVKHIEQTTDYVINSEHGSDIKARQRSDNLRRRIALLVERSIQSIGDSEQESRTEQAHKCASCIAGLKDVEHPYRTLVQSQSGLATETKALTFCSQECFSKYKIREPSGDEASFARLQNAVNEITKSYLDFTQMTLWARFPSSWQIPTNPALRKRLISDWAKIRGLSEDQARESIGSLAAQEFFLAIYATDESGKLLSKTELWDRIRTHLYFVPSIHEMLKPSKFAALKELAEAFRVPAYDGDDWQQYYSTRPEELRNVWKQLRANPAFVKVLYSTVKTFDPTTQTQSLRIDHPESRGRVEQSPAEVVWENAETLIRQEVEEIVDLSVSLLGDSERLKEIRGQLIEQVAKEFPTLKLAFEMKRVYRMFTIRKTLRLWFDNHQRSMLGEGLVITSFPANKTNRTLSSDTLLRELNGLCKKTLTSHQFSVWTAGIIRSHRNKLGHSAPDKARFDLDFYPALKTHFACSGLLALEKDWTDYEFGLEKVNQLIDRVIAEVMEDRQHVSIPRSSVPQELPRGRKLSARAKQAKPEQLELKELLDRVVTGDIQSRVAVEVFETETKTKLDILTKLQEIRRAETKAGKRASLIERSQRAKELQSEKKWNSDESFVKSKKALDQDEKEQERELRLLLASANRSLDVQQNVLIPNDSMLIEEGIDQKPIIQEETELVHEEVPEFETVEQDEPEQTVDYGDDDWEEGY